MVYHQQSHQLAIGCDNAQNIRKLAPPEQVDEYVRDFEDLILKSKEAS